jgi:hypothetical protein
MKKTILFSAIVLLFASCFDASQKPPDKTDMCRRAFIISQSFVKQNLKAPSTARFSSTYQCNDLTESKFLIVSSVDSQNSFGAMIRTSYTISLEFNGKRWEDASNWKMVSLDFK